MSKPIPWKRALQRLLKTRTQRQVADMLGTTDRAVRNWLARSAVPHMPMRMEIVRKAAEDRS